MSTPPATYDGSDPFVFVCYSHADRDVVFDEISFLNDQGFNVWYDDGIQPGSEWSASIASAIERCAAFVYLISPASVASEHCRSELNFALEESRGVLALHLERTEVPGALRLSLSHRQAIMKYADANYRQKLSLALNETMGGDKGQGRSLTLGEFTLDLDGRTLTGSDLETRLDPKDLSVLLHLIEAAPHVVSTDQLLTRNWPGAVVGDNALQQVIARLRKAFNDDSRAPTYIETQPRRGYRFLIGSEEPAKQDEASAVQPEPTRADVSKKTVFNPVIATSLGIVILVVAGLAWWNGQEPDTTEPLLPPLPEYRIDSIALLPPQITGDDPALSTFAEGFLSDLYDELSKNLPNSNNTHLNVKPLTSVFDQSAPPGRIGDALEVGYIVSSRIRSEGEEIRLAATLVRTWDESTIWSDNFELASEMDKESILTYIAHQLRFRGIRDVEDSFSRRFFYERNDPVAVDTVFRGWAVYRNMAASGQGSWRLVRETYRKALELDPGINLTYVLLINAYNYGAGRDLPVSEARRMAYATLEQAQRFGPIEDDEDLLLQRAQIYMNLDMNYSAALADLHRIEELNPNYGWTHYFLAMAYLASGDTQRAEHAMDTAEEIYHLSEQVNFLRNASTFWFTVGDFRRASKLADAALAIVERPAQQGQLLLVKALAQLQFGQIDTASELIDQAWELAGATRPYKFIRPFALLGRSKKVADLVTEWNYDPSKMVADVTVTAPYEETVFTLIALGEFNRAIEAIHEGIGRRDIYLFFRIRSGVQFDPLRDHPGWPGVIEHLEAIEADPTYVRP